MSDAEAIIRGRAAIDAAHAADPEIIDGRPGEAVYADHLENWFRRVMPGAGPVFSLAARAQHLERWAIARSTFPMDRPGYFAWRKAVHARQGQRVRELLAGSGIDEADIDMVATLVAKASPRSEAGQALEDAACLVFLQDELAAFAAQHTDYTREKFIAIIKRTWAKMSPTAHELALGIPLETGLAALVREAVA